MPPLTLPDAARRWVEGVTGRRLANVTPLAGATSSLVARLRFAGGGFGDAAPLVLRLHTKDDWLAREPDLARREASALRAARDAGLPVPQLVAVDETGVAPPWTTAPASWHEAIAIARTPAPPAPACFIHRDFHPGNVLVENGQLAGIVDWVNGCVGPAEVDVAHCRTNLAMLHGPAVADAFAALTGTDPIRQAYWDVADAVDTFCGSANETASPAAADALRALGARTPEDERRRNVDDYLRAAVRRYRLG